MKLFLTTTIFMLSSNAGAATVWMEECNAQTVEGKISKVVFSPYGHDIQSQKGFLIISLKGNKTQLILGTRSISEALQVAALLTNDDADRLHLVIQKQSVPTNNSCASDNYTLEFNSN
jgi:hypothetical protein